MGVNSQTRRDSLFDDTGFHPEFMLTLTSLFELEVDDIISGMPGGALTANVFAVRS